MMDHWERDASGNVRIGALMRHELLPSPMMLLLRLERVTAGEQVLSGQFDPFQVAMTTAQARELAQELVQMADQMEERGR